VHARSFPAKVIADVDHIQAVPRSRFPVPG
jgi:hypothetical protein